MSPGRAQLSPAQPCSALPRPFQSRSDRPCVDQVRKSSSGITTTTRSPGARQAAKSFPRSSPRTCRRRTTFFCFVVSVCVRVRVRVGFWVAMADQGQTPGRPLVTTSAGRGSNTLRGPSGSWPGSSPSRRRAPVDGPYGNQTAGTIRLAIRAAGLNDPLRQEGTWEAPIN